VSEEEAESWHGLWREVGWLLGVDPELLPATYAEEVALYERIKAHQFIPDDDTRALFTTAVADVTRGASERMPLWLKALGGWTLGSKTFLEQLTLRCVDPLLSRHLGLIAAPHWSAAFGASSVSAQAFGRLARESAAVDRASRALMGLLTRELPPVLAGTRAAPRYDDPGFSTLRRA